MRYIRIHEYIALLRETETPIKRQRLNLSIQLDFRIRVTTCFFQ